MKLNAAPTLSLADLEAYDPASTRSNAVRTERRFLCPLCGDGKPHDRAHRSLCANMETGAWNCKRCGQKGKLKDFWQDRPQPTSRERSRIAFTRAFALSPEKPTPVENLNEHPAESQREAGSGGGDSGGGASWRAAWRGAGPLLGTPGADYLKGRGISLKVAAASGACYSRSWHGAPAVLFPLSGERRASGAPIAAHGRHLKGAGKFTQGEKRGTIFRAPAFVNGELLGPFDKRLPAVIVTEGPADALSLASCGFPAVALIGTSGSDWFPAVCAFRRVMLATDDDEAGDQAADALWPELESLAAKPVRLRASEAWAGAKDWNEVLLSIGREALADFLSWRVLLSDFERAGFSK